MTDIVIPQPGEKPTLKTPQELVHIKHKITLLQYKYWVLMVRAFRDAYERGERLDNDKEYCYLPTEQLKDYLGYSPKTADIEQDLEAIRREPIIFNVLEKNGEKAKSGRGFISEWKVTTNRIGVIFPPVIREAIERLDDKGSLFHLLNWRAFNSFTGKYEAILYKLCKDFVGSGGPKPMSVEKFRSYMGIKETEYPDFKRLNQWVISGPIKRINESELSDIEVRAELRRENRKVSEIKFHVKPKRQTMIDFGDHPSFQFAKVSIEPITQREYLSLRPPEEIELCIERANEYAEEQKRVGKDTDLGAIYRKSISEGWHVSYIAKKKRKEALAQESQKKISAAQEKEAQEATQEKEARARINEILTRFDALPDEEKIKLRADYLATLTASIVRKPFEKDGEKSPMHRARFADFVEKIV
jgi:Initiator Replication protein